MPQPCTVYMIVYTDYRFDARVRREAETLAAAGFHVVCHTPKEGNDCKNFLLRGVEIRELSVAKYQGKSQLRYLLSYLHFLVLSFAVCVKGVFNRNLRAVHVHNMPNFLIFSGLIPKLLGRKLILDIHDSIPETFASKFQGANLLRFKLLCLEEKISISLADRVIAVNRPQCETLMRRGLPKAKSFVSMNVPDHKVFTGHNRRVDRQDGRFRLIYHGTMARRLGVDMIIQSVNNLRDKIPNLELNLWGWGDDLKFLQKLSDDLGSNRIVHFTPEGYPFHELPEHLMQMDVGLVGNRKDVATDLMLPVKLMEYVAMEIPVIAPKLLTIRHYFNDDMLGYYVPEDAASLTDAIFRAYQNPEKRQKQAEKAADFLKEYGWEKQGFEFIRFYESLLNTL